jgi:hypothetical protein
VDLLQRFRPGTYWKTMQRQMDKMEARVAASVGK